MAYNDIPERIREGLYKEISEGGDQDVRISLAAIMLEAADEDTNYDKNVEEALNEWLEMSGYEITLKSEELSISAAE